MERILSSEKFKGPGYSPSGDRVKRIYEVTLISRTHGREKSWVIRDTGVAPPYPMITRVFTRLRDARDEYDAIVAEWTWLYERL